MAAALARNGNLFTCVHKYYTPEAWRQFASDHPTAVANNVAVTSGSSDADLERLRAVIAAVPQLSFICLDVANGYSEAFVQFVRQVRSEFPQHTIIAGNVVTGEMVEELILSGADIVKVGIGPGSVRPEGPLAI